MSGAADAAWDAVRTRLLAEPGMGERVALGCPDPEPGGRIVARRRRDALVVKPGEARSAALVAAGAGDPSGPGGRRMREWVAIGDADPAR